MNYRNLKLVPEWAEKLVSALDEKMGFQLEELSPELVRGSMPVSGNTQPMGLWHGGASAVLVETLASLGATALEYPHKIAAGVDLNITHLATAKSGYIHGEAKLLRSGKLASYEVRLINDESRLIAIGRLTCRLISV